VQGRIGASHENHFNEEVLDRFAAHSGIRSWNPRLATDSARTAAPNHTLEHSAQPGDVITVDEKQLQQISTYPIERRWITINRKATGRIAFNEDLLTPVFTPMPPHSELRANKGDSVAAGQPLAVLSLPILSEPRTTLLQPDRM